jgi:hypothetical protein
MDTNKNTFVSKTEFLEFIRTHKPKHGPYASTAKLQSVFGLEKAHEVTRADFYRTFQAHKDAGLDVSLFQEDAPVIVRATHAGGGKSAGAGTGGDPLKGAYSALTVSHFPATKDFPGTLISYQSNTTAVSKTLLLSTPEATHFPTSVLVIMFDAAGVIHASRRGISIAITC